MPTFGLVFILVGGLFVRQVLVGRAKEIPTDLRDAFLAFLNADPAGMATAFQQRGENVVVDVSVPSVAADTSTTTPIGTSISAVGPTMRLANEMMRLGASAQGYDLGKTGPSFYDCSGLAWRAAYNLKLFTGPRFTTSSFAAVARSFCIPVSTPADGDIILWATHHMGVQVSAGTLYSAMTSSSGIGTCPIASITKLYGPPTYWRVNR